MIDDGAIIRKLHEKWRIEEENRIGKSVVRTGKSTGDKLVASDTRHGHSNEIEEINISNVNDLEPRLLKRIYDLLTESGIILVKGKKIPDINEAILILQEYFKVKKLSKKQLSIEIDIMQGEIVKLIGNFSDFVAAYFRYKKRYIEGGMK